MTVLYNQTRMLFIEYANNINVIDVINKSMRLKKKKWYLLNYEIITDRLVVHYVATYITRNR